MSASQQVGRRVHRRINVPALAFALAATLLATNFDAITASAKSKLPPCGLFRQSNCVRTYVFPDGSRYVGGWRNGTMNGHGTLTMPNVGKYVGEFRDGKFRVSRQLYFSTRTGSLGLRTASHRRGATRARGRVL
jgi:hypothetical protein